MRPLVYIAHQVSGDVPGNLARGREFVKMAYRMGFAPVAPWITGCEVLDDSNPVDRELGLQCDFVTVSRCDEIWLCGPRISEGMALELKVAEQYGLKVRSFKYADRAEVKI